MKTKTWGIVSVVGVVLAIGLGMAYQGQAEAIYAAPEVVGAVDVGLANGTGIGAAGAILMSLVAAWKSKSPQKIIQVLSLVCLWGTTLGNKAISDQISTLAASLLAPNPVDALPVPADVKSWISNISGDIIKSIEEKIGLIKEAPKP